MAGLLRGRIKRILLRNVPSFAEIHKEYGIAGDVITVFTPAFVLIWRVV